MSLREYIRDAYPKRIRGDAFKKGSLTYNYDKVRGFLFEIIEREIIYLANNLTLTTSSEVGINELEKFLNIKVDTSKTLNERKTEILSLLYSGKSTIQSIKNLIFQSVGGNEESVKIEEKWRDGGEVFDYTVIINLQKTTKIFQPLILERILKKIHPFHCNVTIETENSFEDGIGIKDTIQTGLHSPLVWAEDGNPQEGDMTWVDGKNTLEGNLWQ